MKVVLFFSGFDVSLTAKVICRLDNNDSEYADDVDYDDYDWINDGGNDDGDKYYDDYKGVDYNDIDDDVVMMMMEIIMMVVVMMDR